MTRGHAHGAPAPDDGQHLQQEGGQTPLTRGVLLRCAADGELTPEGRAALEEHMRACPQDEACIRFEVQLREACSRAMCQCDLPADLRETIAAKLRAGEPVVVARIGADGRVGGATVWIRRWGLAVAAVVAVGIGTTIIIQTGLRAGGNTANAAVVQLSSYLATEHDACVADEVVLSKHLEITDPQAVPKKYQAIFGKPISTELMESANFKFVGAGTCQVPGAKESAHLLFRRMDEDGTEGPLVSVFIEPDPSRLGLKEGTTYAMKDARSRVYAWVSDGLVYYVVTQCSKSCDAARRELHAPANVAQLGR